MRKLMIHDKGEPIYPIILSDSFNQLEKALDSLKINDKKICIVTDSHVSGLYLNEVRAIFEKHSAFVTDFVFPAGEENKNLSTVQKLYEHLILSKFERRDILVALGGGVVGDLTGFTAATYLRGIEFIQIPTSLLAQVDSSIGGKTGVDFSAYKNMVGAFHQPKLVYSNVRTLHSLTEPQYISGLGEIIKHGLIKDIAYYNWLKDNRSLILNKDTETLLNMIEQSCAIKQAVVENDPEEAGERALLNFGHTLGHAVEKLMNFSMLHGECVAVGMVAASWISWQSHMLSEAEYRDIVQTIQDFGLPVSVSGILPEEIVNVSKSDKKMSKGKVKFIKLKYPGAAVIDHSVDDAMLLMAARQIVENNVKVGEQA
jgi:3-dehydroquinate synthase